MTATDEFTRRLRGVLERRYHHLHPFNQRMHRGELSREELQLWVTNRFYYQVKIPIKDALILANCPEPEVRRMGAFTCRPSMSQIISSKKIGLGRITQ